MQRRSLSWETDTREARNKNPMNNPHPKERGALLEELLPRWRRWLGLRYRSLQALHPEIVQDASADLIEYLSREVERSHSDEEIRKIGFTILRRRVADAFRSRAVQATADVPLDGLPAIDPSSNPEEVESYARLLRAVLRLVDKLDKPSRELLLRSETQGSAKPLSDAERQRLSRLRADLRRELAERHGVDVRQFLKE